MLFVAVLQLALVLHVRTTLVDAAAEGARLAARADSRAQDGVARTVDLVTSSLSDRYASDVTADTIRRDDVLLAEVTVKAPAPVIGLLGSAGTITVRGHAILEEQ
ncbi:TadE-like protein [Flavimobilis soli]|uniref:TadE-like protein n=1 Tax=Flavimobilis soli TaxID=442709 RepID=A0A2A9ECV2_9MICO|nr:TadE-like protein [Flavimobilis soli]